MEEGEGGVWSRIRHMPKVQLIGIAVAVGTLIVGFLAYRAMKNNNASGAVPNGVPFIAPSGTATGGGAGAVDPGSTPSPNPPVPSSNPPVQDGINIGGVSGGPHGILSFAEGGPFAGSFTAPSGGPVSPTFSTPHAEPSNPGGNGGNIISLPDLKGGTGNRMIR